MMTINLILVFFVGFFASLFGSIVGSGGLLSVPMLIFLGLPPQVAIATNKVGAVGLGFGALIRFIKAKKVIWSYVFPLSILSFIAAIIGANVLLSLNSQSIKYIIALLGLLLIPLLIFKSKLGTIHASKSHIKTIFGFLLYFLLIILGGFGTGAATLIYYVMILCFGLTIIESSATHKIPGLISSVTNLIIFISHGIINWPFGIALFFGMLFGSYAGAHIAIEKGNSWVKILYIIIIFISSVKLLF